MMDEYIKRSELRETMKHVYEDSTCPLHIAAEVDQYITEAPAADVVEVDNLIEICFHEFCLVAGDSPCGCDGCPYGKYGSENDACYEEYKKRKLDEIRGDNNAADADRTK